MADYLIVRRELQLYNPEYCARPHVVALNKADLLAADWGGPAKAEPSALEACVLHAAQQLQVRRPRGRTPAHPSIRSTHSFEEACA